MKDILTALKRNWAKYLLEILAITIGILGAFILESCNDGTGTRYQAYFTFITQRDIYPDH